MILLFVNILYIYILVNFYLVKFTLFVVFVFNSHRDILQPSCVRRCGGSPGARPMSYEPVGRIFKFQEVPNFEISLEMTIVTIEMFVLNLKSLASSTFNKQGKTSTNKED